MRSKDREGEKASANACCQTFSRKKRVLSGNFSSAAIGPTHHIFRTNFVSFFYISFNWMFSAPSTVCRPCSTEFLLEAFCSSDLSEFRASEKASYSRRKFKNIHFFIVFYGRLLQSIDGNRALEFTVNKMIRRPIEFLWIIKRLRTCVLRCCVSVKTKTKFSGQAHCRQPHLHLNRLGALSIGAPDAVF